MNQILTQDRHYNKGVIDYNIAVDWSKEQDWGILRNCRSMQSLNEMQQVEEEVQNQKQKAEFIQACLAEYGSKNSMGKH